MRLIIPRSTIITRIRPANRLPVRHPGSRWLATHLICQPNRVRMHSMITSPYNQIADWYDQQVRDGVLKNPHELVIAALFELLGDISGQQVCDLACGQGIVARRLAQQGAQVVGIDASERLLEIARQAEIEAPLGIRYQLDDVHRGAALADASFDGVVCNLALMDIPNLDAALATASRILRPGGWFICSIVHPCFFPPFSEWAPQADGTVGRLAWGYFREGFWLSGPPGGVRSLVGAYHRTLSTYLNSLLRVGLTLERFAEPQAPEGFPIHSGFREIPMVLLVRCRRADGL